MGTNDNRFYREPPPAMLKTALECGALAEQMIGDYVKACGAFGDAEACLKVLEMLISKAAVGAVMVGSEEDVCGILLRTQISVIYVADKRKQRN
ncbi:hypothetical protein X986_3910 [Burkholderia pseudomallei]|uniref:hypothetical protein n=1 Tax=Burkholderia pseudomallei TaxID=28450 RepID=UPI0005366F54|nr:hypothetical protein [Burkholderia pseudomallei]KGX12612.1 hypothetical protein X984_3577 [Burkholderia pseudomallei]KGX26652.1 hypothetical protein X986_3910 [Burkholderia pseudomallei]